ncbi:MAG: phosphoglucosamine mutase [Ruminococcaceae bacterium]|nr:phosphoglucosamine mutase [Oscillospiraceae bacterium]
MARLFGTDGVRGVANTELTPDLTFRLGWAGARVLAGECQHKPVILVGQDGRISCGMLEAALIAGICSAGADVLVTGILPTPGIAFLTKKYGCDAGVMISASHNAYLFNGIKYFNRDGYKLPDEIEDRIETLMDAYDEKSVLRPTGSSIGRRLDQQDARRDYTEHLKSRLGLDLGGLRIALDCAHGASSLVAPGLFRDLGAEVVTMGTDPDGININDACGSMHPEHLCALVTNTGCQLGFAFDGDADRMLAVDEKGVIADGDVLLAILAKDMKKEGQLRQDTFVVTVMSNLGLDVMARKNSLSLVKTKVGDRYVLEEMLQRGYTLGGEQSGHMILLEHATTGDGLLSALRLLRSLRADAAMIPLSEARKVMKVFPQVQLNARVPNSNKEAALRDPEVVDMISVIEQQLNGRGRVLVRASGTEPLIRIMLEGEDQQWIGSRADQLSSIITQRYSR